MLHNEEKMLPIYWVRSRHTYTLTQPYIVRADPLLLTCDFFFPWLHSCSTLPFIGGDGGGIDVIKWIVKKCVLCLSVSCVVWCGVCVHMACGPKPEHMNWLRNEYTHTIHPSICEHTHTPKKKKRNDGAEPARRRLIWTTFVRLSPSRRPLSMDATI